jgi:hypothetical protein
MGDDVSTTSPRDARTGSACGGGQADRALPQPEISWVGGRNFLLDREYRYFDARSGTSITVKAGFVFDLSSVPRALWFLIAPFELSIVAPLLHDLMYRYGGEPPCAVARVTPRCLYSRRATDRLFVTAMTQERVRAWRRVAAYWAVRIFGALAWRGRSVARTTAGVH